MYMFTNKPLLSQLFMTSCEFGKFFLANESCSKCIKIMFTLLFSRFFWQLVAVLGTFQARRYFWYSDKNALITCLLVFDESVKTVKR